MWLDAWEWECCGAPFRVGQTVEWSRCEVDVARLTSVLGAELAESVTDAETHHGELPTTAVSGVVTHIRAVFAGDGPASFADREVGDAAEHSAAQALGQPFVGYLVALESA